LPIPLPRAFFNSLQKTQVKLIVSPNTKKTNTIQILRNDQTLVVRIDGIINQQFKNNEPIRTIKKVQISTTTELDIKTMTDVKVRIFFILNFLIIYTVFSKFSILNSFCHQNIQMLKQAPKSPTMTISILTYS